MLEYNLLDKIIEDLLLSYLDGGDYCYSIFPRSRRSL